MDFLYGSLIEQLSFIITYVLIAGVMVLYFTSPDASFSKFIGSADVSIIDFGSWAVWCEAFITSGELMRLSFEIWILLEIVLLLVCFFRLGLYYHANESAYLRQGSLLVQKLCAMALVCTWLRLITSFSLQFIILFACAVIAVKALFTLLGKCFHLYSRCF